jgi:hypothetical protein
MALKADTKASTVGTQPQADDTKVLKADSSRASG